MAEWTDEAREYLDGYLKQVAVLVREQGDDPEEVVAGLRDYVHNEVSAQGGGVVGVEMLLDPIRSLGSPEQVANADRASSASHLPRAQRASTHRRAARSIGFYLSIVFAAFLLICAFIFGAVVISYDRADPDTSPGYITEDQWREAEEI